MLLSGAWGKVIHEKNLKQKISWHCPFNLLYKSGSNPDTIRNTGLSSILYDFCMQAGREQDQAPTRGREQQSEPQQEQEPEPLQEQEPEEEQEQGEEE